MILFLRLSPVVSDAVTALAAATVDELIVSDDATAVDDAITCRLDPCAVDSCNCPLQILARLPAAVEWILGDPAVLERILGDPCRAVVLRADSGSTSVVNRTLSLY